MKKLRAAVYLIAAIVFLICLYAFLQGNGVFKGEFTGDSIAWYFLAKGFFCSTLLVLTVQIVGALKRKK